MPGLSTWLSEKFELPQGGGKRILEMEGLRAFSVVLVFFVHYCGMVVNYAETGSFIWELTDYLGNIGHSGVDLFFILSGYLIYGHLLEKPFTFGKYFKRRIKRIYPTFLAVLAIYLVLSLVFKNESKIPHDISSAALYILCNIMLLPGIFDIRPIITVAWSLSYEAFFYLTVPVIINALDLKSLSTSDRFNRVLLVMLGFVALSLLYFGRFKLIMFIGGMLLYEIVNHRNSVKFNPFVALFFAIMGILLLGVSHIPYPVRMVIILVGFMSLCHAAFTNHSCFLARTLSCKYLRWFGNMSYSYFLIHGLVLKFYFWALAKTSYQYSEMVCFYLLLPAFLLTVLVSALLYLLVERPFSVALPAVRQTIARSSVSTVPENG